MRVKTLVIPEPIQRTSPNEVLRYTIHMTRTSDNEALLQVVKFVDGEEVQVGETTTIQITPELARTMLPITYPDAVVIA